MKTGQGYGVLWFVIEVFALQRVRIFPKVDGRISKS